MKRMIVAVLLCFCVTACAHMNITPISETAKKLDRAGKVVVVIAADGRYGAKVYSGTGDEFTSLVMVEFAKFAAGYEILPRMELPNALSVAKEKGAMYVVVPEILHYEDRNTPWSGRLDQITVKVSVYLVEDGSMAQSSMITANNQVATFVDNRPMVLIYKPLTELVKNFY